VSRLQYSTDIKLIRVMCTGRVDLSFVLRAFLRGKDGVFIGGCHLGDCHYVTEGNYHALHMVHLAKKLLEHIGVNPGRLRVEWVSAGEGIRFVDVVNRFSQEVREIGPLGTGDGLNAETLRLRLEALNGLLPWIRLVERERLRVRFPTEEEYEAYFQSADVDTLIRELIEDKLTISQIMSLLRDRPRTLGEISDVLHLTPSEASRHLGTSAKHGLIRYHNADDRFALA
jgi:F420-non-reducing hydrogenase iron-sulfur subunit